MSGKTKKSIIKRFRTTKNNKLMRRPQHQDHLNAKDSGQDRRKKRKGKQVKQTMAKRLIESKVF